MLTEDRLRATADAFGVAPTASFQQAHASMHGDASWSGSLIGVDLSRPMLPPVFGDVELRIDLSNLRRTLFDELTTHVNGVSSAFVLRGWCMHRCHRNSFSDSVGASTADSSALPRGDGRVLGDRTASVNLLASFGGKR